MSDGLFWLFLAVGVFWAAQMWLAQGQAKRFMRSVSRLRRLGATAVGVSTLQRIPRKSYMALSCDPEGRVTGAVELAGLTVWARPKAVPELEGQNLRALTDIDHESADRRERATAMAARTLLDARKDETGSRAEQGEPVPDTR